ncbi:hypothetical protein GCM10010285_19070 [Streptomyces pseudogriseolus]|uniref:Uncharacterized protein n=1 Tax=Streptomyces pseudogriseolus TaxID=36817 RepID=A0ABQ2SW05_STREZ|nr:hypothetical protein GCM10010285_19070 [Streptomyces rubiginosus]
MREGGAAGVGGTALRRSPRRFIRWRRTCSDGHSEVSASPGTSGDREPGEEGNHAHARQYVPLPSGRPEADSGVIPTAPSSPPEDLPGAAASSARTCGARAAHPEDWPSGKVPAWAQAVVG